jgi:homoserine O-acetyltransferase
MEFIIIINSSYKTNGYRYVVSKSINSVMMASDDFSAGIYNESLSRLMVSINQILYSNYFSRKLFQEMSNDEIDYLMEEYIEQSLHRDIYDLKYQNDAIINYNVENQLSNIKAKTLVFYPSDDLYFSKKYDCLPLKDLIDDCEVVFFDLADDFYDGPIDFEKLVDILNPFLEDYCK